MYTGEMIENLIEKVEDAEATAFVKVTQARRAANVTPLFETFIYEFGRSRDFGRSHETIGVA
jgi:hypothetical protein